MRAGIRRHRAYCLLWMCTTVTVGLAGSAGGSQVDLPTVIGEVQPKIVKIYGAGGIRGLEAYQTGFLIQEDGQILTAWSYVLDTEYITAVLDDGRKFKAELVGADPRTEVAILQIEGDGFPFFDLEEAATAQTGDRVLAFSNLYGIAVGNEPASVLHGHVSAMTQLSARRGVYETTYGGMVYVLDAMTNNAGAAGGALTDYQGQLLGILGKELRNAQSNAWLNFAIPIDEIRPSIDAIRSGTVRRRNDSNDRKPVDAVTLARLGLVLIPDVLVKTPPFVERVVSGSPAEACGIQSDDLILLVGANMVQSRKELVEELSYIDRLDPVRLTVLRDQELLDFEMLSED